MIGRRASNLGLRMGKLGLFLPPLNQFIWDEGLLRRRVSQNCEIPIVIIATAIFVAVSRSQIFSDIFRPFWHHIFLDPPLSSSLLIARLSIIES